ncbi:MAG: hypothetical protein L3J47_00975 [Sulfurovum sp.]|nr:hypothetical protein [Sulfurovum sp.]
MSKILYIHGFGSCGSGQKSTVLRHYFGKENVDAPDLPPSPKDAIALLESMIEGGSYALLVGSSLGGFYATWLTERYGGKAVLLNPSTEPYMTLASHTGWQKRFCDGEVFEFKPIYLEQLKQFRLLPQSGDYLVLLQSGDEVLDYQKAHHFYEKHRIIVEYGGNHRFENIDDYLCMIGNFKNAE